jgi:SAM-dependent methyltransferase
MADFNKVWKDEFRGQLFIRFIKRYFKDISKLTALDVGCRYGAFTFNLAKELNKVIGIDVDANIIKETKVKAESFKNLEIREESILKTKFKDNQFDLIVLEGVLEWVGCSNPHKSQIECQVQAIQECFRILKTGGLVYVGIENRFYPYHWFKDPHGYTPFTAILPKSISIVLYQHLKNEYYGQNVMSYWGYQKYFKKVFDKYQILIPLPTYKYLFKVSTFKGKELRYKIKEVLKNKSIKKSHKIMIKLLQITSYFWLSKMFAKDFVIICKK